MFSQLPLATTSAGRPPTIGKALSTLLLLAGSVLAGGGCATPAGVIFPPLPNPILWPAGQEQARIRYVGQLATSADLKPSVPAMQRLGEAVFGKRENRSMLTPYAVCTDGGDRIFVADSNAQAVHVFDLKTRKYASWRPTAAFSQPVGVAYDATRGRLYVADSVAACVFVFDAAGKQVGIIAGDMLVRPAGITFDARSDRLFVTDVAAHQILIFSGAGTPLARLGKRGAEAGEFNFPTNVAVDSLGRLYVSDSLNFRVQQFDSDLKFVRQIGRKGDMPGYFAQPKGIAIDSEDHLYVVDANFEAVQVFDSDGNLLMDFGGEGHGPGQFWLPAGIYFGANDRMFVADAYNRRIQVFDYLAEVRR